MAGSERRKRLCGGSAQIIEMTVVLPVCLAVVAAAAVFGIFGLDGFLAEQQTARVLSSAAREMTLPGSSFVYSADSDSVSRDVITVYRMFGEKRPYRYLSRVTDEELDTIASDICLRLDASGLCQSGNSCSVRAERRVSGILLTAEVERKLDFGSFFGLPVVLKQKIKVAEASFDNPESVRNTRLLTDAAGYLKDALSGGTLPEAGEKDE